MSSMEIVTVIGWVMMPVVLAFYMLDSKRVTCVRGSEQRYRLTSITWMLLWPTYASLAMWGAQAIITHDVIGIVLVAMHLVFIAKRHARLSGDNDDNQWRSLKRKIKAGIKRLSQVRMPQLAPPVTAPNAA